ncbi:MAG: hypothetical protein RJA10_149 [Pseudomonadota bacterium]|jgi:hypothetical protein
MSLSKLIAPLLLTAASGLAIAAPPPKAVLLDHSSSAVMDADTAKALLAEGIPAKVWKVYPASKWAYSSQVEGGITSSGICVITARVMLLPLTPTMKATLLRPRKTATAFDAQAGATADQCKELAKVKLKQAIEGVVSSLAKT